MRQHSAYPYRMAFDLSALTDAQLSTMQTNLVAMHAKVTTGGESYSIGTRSLKRPSLASIMEQLAAISTEISSRADTTGGTGVVEFGEPV